MAEFKIEPIIKSLQEVANINKDNFDYMIEFLAIELLKSGEKIDDHVIDLIASHLQNKYYSSEYVSNSLRKTISQLQNNYSKGTLSPSQNSFQTLIEQLSHNKEVGDDNASIRFGPKHLGLLRKIFFLDIAQNYLSALKWIMTDDIVNKQNKFNHLVEDSFKEITSDLEEAKKEFSIAITELKNYARDSENWIHNIEYKLDTSVPKLSEIDAKIESTRSKLSEIDSKFSTVEPKLSEQKSKLVDFEEAKKEFSNAITELKNYARDSENWTHEHEIMIEEFQTRFDYIFSQFENMALQQDQINSRFDNHSIPGYLISKIFQLESQLKHSRIKEKNFHDISKKILYFLHIPKTAGTSFIDILDYFFDSDDILQQHDWQQLLPNSPKKLNSKLLHGHFGYGIYRLLPKKPVYITMLRNPIDRTISDYRQSMRTKDMGSETEYFKNSDLSELVNNPSKKWRFTNNQAKHIAFDIDPTKLLNSDNKQEIDKFSRFLTSEFTSALPDDRKLLKQAKKHLEEFAFVGITEKFEESMQLLCYTFGWKPIHNIPSLNMSPNNPFKENLSTKTLNDIKKCTTVDSQLYDFALELFDKRFSNMIQDLMDTYYDSSLSHLSFKELVYAMLEKHYAVNFWKNKPPVASLEYDFSQPLFGTGWHSREQNSSGTFYCWTGPDTASTIDLPKIRGGNKTIEVHVSDSASKFLIETLKFYVNNSEILMEKHNTQDNKITFKGIIQEKYLSSANNFTTLKFVVDKTISVKRLAPNSSDYRNIGIAVERIIIN